MNTLSKVLLVSCVLLSVTAYGFWVNTPSREVSSYHFDAPVSVATSADGKIVYVGKAGQVYKSTDGGETWLLLK